MKAASSTSLSLKALSCALLLPLIAGACGSEAPPPVVINQSGGGQSNSAGTGAQPISGSAGTAPSGSGGAGATPSGGSAGAENAGSSSSGAAVGGGSAGGGGSGGGAGGGGSGGATGTGGTAGSAPDLTTEVGGPLTGQMLLGPCLGGDDPLVCQTLLAQCPGDKTDFALSGVLTTDKEITLGGDPATVYTITLHVQGEVEAKSYGTTGDQEKSKASPMADGFQVGGTPSGGDAYNVYMLRVTSPKQDYFFNALIPPGKSDHTTYGIDYTGKIQANGGTKIRLVAADRNCSMIKNCGPNNNGGTCNAPITIANIDPTAKAKNPSFNFNDPYNGQWVVMVVTAVVAN